MRPQEWEQVWMPWYRFSPTAATNTVTVWWDKPGAHPGSDALARMSQLGRGPQSEVDHG